MLDLVQQQLAIEQLMADEAANRQIHDQEQAKDRKEYGASHAGRTYVKELTKLVYEPVSEFVMGAAKKKHGKHHIAATSLLRTGIDPKVIAWLTCKAIINQVAMSKKGMTRANLCNGIGDIIHDEWRVRFFEDNGNRKKLLKKLFQDFDKRSYPRAWRKETIKNYFDLEQLDWDGWDKRQKIHIGYALFCIFRDATGFIDMGNDKRITFSDDFHTKVTEFMKNTVHQFTLYRPMVVPPKPWAKDQLFRGGYMSHKIRRYAIIKGMGKRDKERLEHFDWDRILPPINALQETPWRINRDMLEALSWSYSDHGGDIGKLVRCNPIPLPPLPEGFETDEAVKRKHMKEAFLIHDRNRQDKSKRISALMTIAMGNQFAQFDAIYFPHNMDSRGRAYPLPAFLNPQGPDYSKALLEFSKGEPVETQDQADWIAICGANAYGNDKVSLKERVQWVHDNEEMIIGCAEDYRHDRRWMAASEPFQFLRFCFEWAAYRSEGYGYKSHLVVPVDATCSGLQHYAAMLRDEVGGRSVNLVPGLPRQDIYGDVAACVIQKLAQDGSEAALRWIDFGIDRKTTKRQVMVVPYAGKFSSCLAYTKEAVAEKLATGILCPWDLDTPDTINEEPNPLSHHQRQLLLARYIWEAIDEVVVKGKEAMKWLSTMGSEWGKKANTVTEAKGYQKRMTWLTPDGFEVAHYRPDEKKHRLETKFDGTVKLDIMEATDTLSVSGMALAIAPNFVHSLDATHLRLTITEGLRHGIHDYGMVHDSFGVHARHMPDFLSKCVKPSFIAMYRDHDVLQELSDSYQNVINTPAMPTKGSLDIEAIANSEFFFS